jgi:hypothetical protein
MNEPLKKYLLSLVDESFDGFAGENFEKEFRLLVMDWYESKNYWEAYEKNDDRNAMDIKWKILLDWLSAREKTQKEKLKQIISQADFSKFENNN